MSKVWIIRKINRSLWVRIVLHRGWSLIRIGWF